MQIKKSEQVIAVTCKRTVWAVRIFLADKACFFKVFDGSTDSFLRDTEFSGDPFHTRECHVFSVTVVIKVYVDELRPMGKLVVSV
jgi:hypothetical protein